MRVPWARCRLLLGRFLRTRQTLAQRSLNQEKCNEPARPSRRETALWNTTFPYFCSGCRRTPKPAARRHVHATLRTTVRMLSATHFWTVIPQVSGEACKQSTRRTICIYSAITSLWFMFCFSCREFILEHSLFVAFRRPTMESTIFIYKGYYLHRMFFFNFCLESLFGSIHFFKF